MSTSWLSLIPSVNFLVKSFNFKPKTGLKPFVNTVPENKTQVYIMIYVKNYMVIVNFTKQKRSSKDAVLQKDAHSNVLLKRTCKIVMLFFFFFVNRSK